MDVDRTAPETYSEEIPRPTRMVMSVGAIPWGVGFRDRFGIRRRVAYVYLDGHDGENGLCGVWDGKEHDEDKLEDEVKGAALDAEHHCAACNAFGDVKRRVGDGARGARGVPETVNNERGNDDICAKGKNV